MRVAIYDNVISCRGRLKDIITAALLISDVGAEVSLYDTPTGLLKDLVDGEPFDFVVYSEKPLLTENNSTLKLVEEKSNCVKLIKPYTIKDIIYNIKPMIVEFGRKDILVMINRKVHAINTNDIMYIESENNKCIFHLSDGKVFVQYKPLDEIEKQISLPAFLRCHKSYLVNMDYIVSAEKSFILTNGDEVLIRQREVSAIRRKFVEYRKNNLAKVL